MTLVLPAVEHLVRVGGQRRAAGDTPVHTARALGDRLVVGLNTDASVSAIKPGRPIQDETSRARIMAALGFVDAVVFFGEQTPLHLIEQVQPDILVKGDDYSIDGIVGHELVLNKGGQVLTVPLVAGYSTSRIVEKVRG